MAKKAISPLIAIIVLVALVVTLGGLLSVWLTSFFYEASSEDDTCAITTLFTVTGPTYNASDGQIKLMVKNTGRDDLYNFTLELDNGTLFALVPATSPNETYSLAPGRSQYVMANASHYNITNIDTVKLLVASCPTHSSSTVKVANI